MVEFGVCFPSLRELRLPFPLAHPLVAGLLVRLVDRPIDLLREPLGVLLYRSPEIRHKGVDVVDGLVLRYVRRGEVYGAAAIEGLDVVVQVRTEAPPYLIGYAALTAEIWER